MKNKNVLPLIFAFFISVVSYAQITISTTINNATIASTCGDPFGGQPDPLFEVNINNEGWVTYPQEGACFTALPNQQYQAEYFCADGIPLTINVCFKVYDNDGFFGCALSEDCAEQICQDFILPITGNGDFTLSLPNGGGSSGTLNFNINVNGTPFNPINDEICNAIDLGEITPGAQLGDASIGQYNNFCATFNNEPNPCDDGTGSWCITKGVWYSFTTGNDDLSNVTITALSDPENVGLPLPIQITVYEAINGSCTNLDFMSNNFGPNTIDETILFSCLEANSTYYFGIDGPENNSQPDEGVFGLQIEADNFLNGGDLPCEAYDFGAISLGGSVSLAEPVSNNCATGTGDPADINFGSQNSVYFTFTPPPTGHVLIEGTSLPLDEIGLQIAVYYSTTNACDGTLEFVDGSWTSSDLDETLQISCLDPNLTYWILVDGEVVYGTGLFDLTISDAGNITPETTNSYVFCAGETLNVGSSIYDISGFYSDTLSIGGGCTEIINSDLTILDELIIDLQIIDAASSENEPDGEATATAIGGDGNYIFTWPNALVGGVQTTLEGGENYCVTVTDGSNCTDFICFDMPFIDFILPTITDGTVACNGDANGTISFFVQNGFPPYTYTWTGNGLNGNGNIAAEMEDIFLTDLPAGVYTINVTDNVMDTTFMATITEPEILEIINTSQIEASCFEECDGEIMIDITGGTPPYSYAWTNGNVGGNSQDLCAGFYAVTVTDMNDCVATAEYTITEPEEFIATININNHVTCFEGFDGSVSVITNGTPIDYAWDNGGIAANIDGLAAGDYNVLVTNEDGCQTTATITIEEPQTPVGGTIEILQEISCGGTADGMLRATGTGAGNTFTYTWSNGETGAVIDNLLAGQYFVTISNEVGCLGEAAVTIDEPAEITMDFRTENITCPGGDNSGVLSIEQVTGGVEPYSYSLDGDSYNGQVEYSTLTAGNYTLYLEDAVGCLKTYDFSISPPPELLIDLGPDQEILLGETVDLVPSNNSNDLLYTWSSSEVLEECMEETCPELNIQPLNTGIYSLTVIDTVTLCTASTNVNIFVNKERHLFFPTAFSPNNDGINDKFLIYGQRAVLNVNYMHIFDRYGAQIYSITDFMPDDANFGWDGFYKGKSLSIGVYTWMTEIEFIDGETEMFAGSVTLLK